MATGRIGTTPVLQVRWSKAPSAGTTSLSGLDDNSVSLVYSVGYEAVYRNGVLLSRTNDYTATDGTTVTLIDATIAGDIIEIFANQTIPLADTYSQTVANGKFINNTLTTTTGDIIYASAANTPARLGIGSTNQVLTVSGGVPAWAAASGDFVKVASGSFSAASTITVDNCFTSTYKRYVVYATWGASAAAATRIQLRYGSTTETGNYYGSGFQYARNNTLTTYGSNPTSGNIPLTSGTGANIATIVFGNVGTGGSAEAAFYGNGIANNFQEAYFFSGKADTARDYTGFLISGASGTFTGSYSVYGLKD
jgi:hypothetical protein